MGIISRLFGSSEEKPEPVVIHEVDVNSDEYKNNPWPVPWESETESRNDSKEIPPKE